MVGLLVSVLLKGAGNLGVALTVGLAGHGQVHADLAALADKVVAEALDDLRVDAVDDAHLVLRFIAHLFILLDKLVGADAAHRADKIGGKSVALIDVTADAANKLSHDRPFLLCGSAVAVVNVPAKMVLVPVASNSVELVCGHRGSCAKRAPISVSSLGTCPV